jgi:TIR domain
MARIFFSYRSLDRESALALEGTATAAGHRVFLDCLPEGGINVGDDWERRLYDGLYESHALVALISAAYIESQWCFAELAIARARGLLILPVVLSSGLRHPLLGDVQHLDGGGDLAATGERLLARLRDLEAPGAAGWSPDRPLYAGLEPFDVADAAVFFGRSQETANLLELVVSSTTHARRQPVFVTGASGCGKSSMVRAGLIPALHRRGGWLSVPPVIPGESPIDALRR